MRNTNVRLRHTGACLLLAVGTSISTVARAGQGVWTSNGPYGGDITALAIDPANPATLYAATSGSGVFKSADGGGSWTAINSGLTETNVWRLVVSPSRPATLYVTTPRGVFKSVDSGSTWAVASNGSVAQAVNVLVIDPTNPDTLYAGTYGDGVLKSNDGGGSWTAINSGLSSKNVVALTVDPSTPTTLYASTQNQGGGVFKSTNGGGSWTAANTGLAGGLADVLAIDPSTPATLYAYAGTYFGLFKSNDGGGAWTAVSRSLTATNVYDLAIVPTSPATLYASTYGDGVFKSTDGGETWNSASTGLTDPVVHTLALDRSAPATLYAGTFLGVFKSMNGGRSWTAASVGLKVDVNALAIDPSTPTSVYAGAAPFGGVFKSTDRGGNWTAIHALYNELQALAVNPSAPDSLYAGTSSDFFYDYPGFYSSTDGGAHWTQSSLVADVYAVAIDPSAPATFYAGTGIRMGAGGGIFKSTDGATSWHALTAPLELGPDPRVRALVIDPSSSATLYAGTERGGAFKSTDAGVSWSAINTGLTSIEIRALAIDPSEPTTIYAGTDGGVFKSPDGGNGWFAVNTGLTNLNVNALAINPTAPTMLYAGTGGGVFRSTDSGGTWAAFNTGLPNLPVNALALDPSGEPTLYAGLEGGGVWQLTGFAAGTITALLPASAHAHGANGAFYTTDVTVANTGVTPASITLKFLGHDQDGSSGPERSFRLDPGESRTFVDVLGSEFGQTSGFGAIRITSNTPSLGVVSVTSTPGFGGTFGQAIPAVAFADLIPAGSSRSILYIREGDGFRTNLILASGSSVSTDIDVALVLPEGEWDYARTGQTLATKTYRVPPNGMIQVNRIAKDMGVSGAITGARLVLSSSTAGALFTGLASVIDETTNDPTVVPAQAASVTGSAPTIWLLPSSVHSGGSNGAFYTTNVSVANVGATPASFTMKFLGHDGDGSGGPEQTFNLGAGGTVTYFDVLGSVFHQTSAFGAIRITLQPVGRLGGASSSPSLNVVSVTSTPGFGGTLSQTFPAIASTDLIPAGSQRSIPYIREGDGFRTNLVLASNAEVFTTVDVALASPAGEILARKSYAVPPSGMTQIDRIVRDMGVSAPITGARLVLSSPTTGAAFTAFASVIDEVTNDPTAVEAK